MPGTSSTIALRFIGDCNALIKVIDGPDTGLQHRIHRRALIIGSQDTSDLVLRDPLVSPRHLELIPATMGWIVKDLHSLNGSFINDRLIDSAPWLPGQVLQIGNSRLSMELIREPTDRSLVKQHGQWVEIPRLVAHELNNYLAFLGAGVEHLRRDPDISRRFETDIKGMNIARENMDDLVQTLRAGCVPLRSEPFDLCALCWEQLAVLESMAEVRGIEMTCHIPERTIMIRGDDRQLGRAVINLLKNAFDASNATDTVSLTLAADSAYAFLDIADTGRGMDRETLESMWVPLFTTKPGGNGLGAFIADMVIRRHNGTVSVDSVPGNGTRISIRLPRNHDGVI